MSYTKEFLVSAFLSRYYTLPEDKFSDLEKMADNFYDRVGKETFRVYCSLDAAAIKFYREQYD